MRSTDARRLHDGMARHALDMLRATVALAFLAHAVVRLVNGSVPRFAAFLDAKGFTHGVAWVLAISICEIACGLLLVAGVQVHRACAALACVVAGGIVLVHAPNGWFVGEHGSGGMEYSVLLLASLFAVAMSHPARSAPSASRRDGRGLEDGARPPV